MLNGYKAIVILTCVLFLGNGFCIASQPFSETETRQIILLRKIGHQLLLSSGDKTSVVLPVTKADNIYIVSFENVFALVPDSLTDIATRLSASGELTGSYILTITRERDNSLVYGFTSEDIEKGTVPCLGRKMPAEKYQLRLQVRNPGSANYPLMVSAVFIAGAAVSFAGVYRRKKRTSVTVNKIVDPNQVAIGEYRFLFSGEQLYYKDEIVILTPKETTLLKIFLKSPNEVIDRNLLLKLGWEDEGVITGRSLDMYVSKLRKILSKDESVSIKNIHGKGYSLIKP